MGSNSQFVKDRVGSGIVCPLPFIQLYNGHFAPLLGPLAKGSWQIRWHGASPLHCSVIYQASLKRRGEDGVMPGQGCVYAWPSYGGPLPSTAAAPLAPGPQMLRPARFCHILKAVSDVPGAVGELHVMLTWLPWFCRFHQPAPSLRWSSGTEGF